MKTIFLPSVIALALAFGAGAPPAHAQAPACPPGYYFASDGRCYPGGPPVYAPPIYAPPAYVVAPPVYPPPVVFDGFGIGFGFGGGRGGWHGHR